MPSASLIAAEEEESSFQEMFETSKSLPCEEQFVETVTAAEYDALRDRVISLETKIDRYEADLPEEGIEFGLETVPEGTPDAVLTMLEARDYALMIEESLSSALGAAYDAIVLVSNDAQDKVAGLTKAVAVLGVSNQILEESRDRARARNCDSVDEICAGRRIAEAAARSIRARLNFDRAENAVLFTGVGIPDAVVEEVAGAEASLEQLLIDGKYLEG